MSCASEDCTETQLLQHEAAPYITKVLEASTGDINIRTLTWHIVYDTESIWYIAHGKQTYGSYELETMVSGIPLVLGL